MDHIHEFAGTSWSPYHHHWTAASRIVQDCLRNSRGHHNEPVDTQLQHALHSTGQVVRIAPTVGHQHFIVFLGCLILDADHHISVVGAGNIGCYDTYQTRAASNQRT